jgi:hypothetical protein
MGRGNGILIDRPGRRFGEVALLRRLPPADTSTASGRALFDMPGVFAEFKTDLRANGRLKASPPAIPDIFFPGFSFVR